MSKIGDWLKETFVGEEDDEIEVPASISEEPEKRETERKIFAPKEPKANVVSINQTVQLEVVLERPDTFDQAMSIGDNINEKRAVVLNLEATNKEVARRIIDFLAGVTYANAGKMQRVANSTYLITPRSVGLLGGEIVGELESNGVYFG